MSQPVINQALVLLCLLVFCVGVVTLLFWIKDILFSACRVVRRMWK